RAARLRDFAGDARWRRRLNGGPCACRDESRSRRSGEDISATRKVAFLRPQHRTADHRLNFLNRHCERSEAIQLSLLQQERKLDCFVAALLAMTERETCSPSNKT